MATYSLFDETMQSLSVNDFVTVPHLDSCCLVILWLSDKTIVALHCQYDYRFAYNQFKNITSAVYITAKPEKGDNGKTLAAVKRLQENLKAAQSVYYVHKEMTKNVSPIVQVLDNMKYNLYKESDYAITAL